MLVGILNVIWGIAAIGDSSFFIHDTRYILSNLNTWGWVTVILGAVQILAAYSIWSGNQFGRWVGITVAGLSSIGALMSIPAYPFWSLAIFAVDILVIYGLAAYGGQHRSLLILHWRGRVPVLARAPVPRRHVVGRGNQLGQARAAASTEAEGSMSGRRIMRNASNSPRRPARIGTSSAT